MLTLGTFNGIVKGGDPPPVVVDSIEPAEIVQGQVPQATRRTEHMGLHVVDISDPAAPVIVGTHNDGSDCRLGPVALSGGLAYVADSAHSGSGDPAGWMNTKGLAVFDVATDPTNPTLVGKFKTHGNVTGVEIIGNRAYVYDDGEGLIILDVTDPTNPVILADVDENYPLGDGIELDDAFAVAVQNQRVYVAGRGTFPGAGGISVVYSFDASDPMLPVLLDVVPYVGGTRSVVCVDEPDVFVTDGSVGGPQAGLVLLELVALNSIGDLDGDGSVGASDLLILLASWGPCPLKGECTADLNDDGVVGAADLLILLANWG